MPRACGFSWVLPFIFLNAFIVRNIHLHSLGKQAYSNILKISPPKNESFQIKMLIFFIFLFKTKIVGTR